MSLLPLYLAEENFDPCPVAQRARPPRLTGAMVKEALTLPLRIDRTKTVQNANNITELNIDEIRHKMGYRALLLNIFGPVLTDYEREPDPAVLNKVKEMHKKMLLCLIPENNQPAPRSLTALGIPIAYGFTPHADARCYTAISSIFVQTRHNKTTMLEAEKHLVIGSNYLTDVNCRDADMHYLHINPAEGVESRTYRLLRKYGDQIARIHHAVRKLRQNWQDTKTPAPEPTVLPNPYLPDDNGRKKRIEL